MTSTTNTRWWAWAVESSRSRQSVAKATAVSKPKVETVPSRSLSMVLGTPITRTPLRARAAASSIEPSPPIEIRASVP